MSFGIYLTNLGTNVSRFLTVAPATSQTISPVAAVAQKSLQQLSSDDDIYYVRGEKTPELVSEILDMVGVPLFVTMFIVSAVNYLIRALASETMSEFDQTKIDIQLAVEKLKSLCAPDKREIIIQPAVEKGATDKREIILFRDEDGTSTVARADLFVGQAESEFEEISLN